MEYTHPATGETVTLWLAEEVAYNHWREQYIETGDLSAFFQMIDSVKLDEEESPYDRLKEKYRPL